MSLRSRLGMFVLTRQEQRTIAFIVLAVILGLLTQHYRHRHAESARASHETIEQSPTPPSATRQKLDLRKQVPPEGRASARPGSTPRSEAGN